MQVILPGVFQVGAELDGVSAVDPAKVVLVLVNEIRTERPVGRSTKVRPLTMRVGVLSESSLLGPNRNGKLIPNASRVNCCAVPEVVGWMVVLSFR